MKKVLDVLIVDDDLSRSSGWEKAIQSFGFNNVSVRAVKIDETKEIMRIANERRISMRPGSPTEQNESKCILDDIDLLIVDYDLQELLNVGEWATGLQIATLARAFTSVKYIALINQFGTNTFDLTLTKSQKSKADSDIGSDQLLSAGLWKREKKIGEFSPWYWQEDLLTAPARSGEMQSWVASRLDLPVLQELGLNANPEGDTPDSFIPKELWQELTDDPGATFRTLAIASNFLPIKDNEYLAAHDAFCTRIATALLSHWIDRVLIPAGEVLVDVPHLVSASPWLVLNPSEKDQWDSTTESDDQALAYLHPLVAEHRFLPGFPLARPALWRRKIANDARLVEPVGFSYEDFPDYVFCEDISAFLPFEAARSFACRLPGPDDQRFVADPAKMNAIIPEHNLAAVTYEPSVLFAL